MSKENARGMQDDTISREQAIDVLVSMTIYTKEELKEYREESAYKDCWTNGIYDAVEKIEKLPTIQPKRGRWEMGIDERFVECSECGLMTTRNELRGIAVFGKNEPNFCPNCGADMRQKGEDSESN